MKQFLYRSLGPSMLFLSFFCSIPLLAQDFDIDQGFNAKVYASGGITQVIELADGKILIAGGIQFVNDERIPDMVRLDSLGQRDPAFALDAAISGTIVSTKLRPNGKIILAGDFDLNGTEQSVIQIHEDGRLDTSFNFEPKDIFYATQIELFADGSIMVGGFTNLSFTIHRVRSNGERDNSFNLPEDRSGYTMIFAVAPSGKVYITAGSSFQVEQRTDALIELNADGSLGNPVFADVLSTINNSTIKKLAVTPSSELILMTRNKYIYRSLLQASGWVKELSSEPNAISIQENGDVYFSYGRYNLNNGEIIRGDIYHLRPFSEIEKFNTGNGADYGLQTIQELTDGGVIAAGNFNSFENQRLPSIVKLDATGQINSRFKPKILREGAVLTVTTDNEGRVLIGGEFNFVGDEAINHVARLNTDGSLDTSFNKQVTELGRIAHSVHAMENGDILVSGGYHAALEGKDDFLYGFEVLDQNGYDLGVPDLLFNLFNGRLSILGVDSNGKVYLGGAFIPKVPFIPSGVRSFIRLDENFVIDTSFARRYERSGVYDVIINKEGDVYLMGSDISYDGASPAMIIKLDENDNLDNTFVDETGLDRIIWGALFSDGSLVVAGTSRDSTGVSVSKIVNINPDGRLNSAYTIGEVDGYIGRLFTLPNDEVLIPGIFGMYNQQMVSRSLVLNRDGTLNREVPAWIEGFIRDVHQSDRGLYLAGTLVTNEQDFKSSVLRLNVATSTQEAEKQLPVSAISLFPNPTRSELFVQSNLKKIQTAQVQIFNLLGQPIARPQPLDLVSTARIDLTNLPTGIYFLEVIAEQGRVVKSFVKE